MSYGKKKEYECPYCLNKFEAMAKATGGEVDKFGRKRQCISNTIECPHCGNFLKTWDGDEERDWERVKAKK